ncbi:winged helix-turn-helix domain-containing protein [Pseudogemmobacter sonorensis]|uniref:winged helix-turn-helix domain-containing protein n=1 Tax=Pseudogemmobacter sonorensis TaxID=2989681 RepID=UPI0036B450F7
MSETPAPTLPEPPAPDLRRKDPVRLRLRVHFGDRLMLGPGKADLLAGIAETGSIAASGRRMGMSYKRAWMLVEEMNAAFTAPLVASTRGGAGGGGAHLTPTGEAVLAHYRALMAATARVGTTEIDAISALMRPDP